MRRGGLTGTIPCKEEIQYPIAEKLHDMSRQSVFVQFSQLTLTLIEFG